MLKSRQFYITCELQEDQPGLWIRIRLDPGPGFAERLRAGLKNLLSHRVTHKHTVCPRSSDPFYIVSYTTVCLQEVVTHFI